VKAAIYARVSTSNHGQDISLQLRELRDYIARRGWQIVGEYTDSGVSGSKERRPQLDRLMHDAKRQKFDAVLCWKLDRIGRSLKHLVNLLAELEAFGVVLVSLSDSLDLSTPQGRLMFQIIAAMAEFERSLIQERVRAGRIHSPSHAEVFRLGLEQSLPLSKRLDTFREKSLGHNWDATLGRNSQSLLTPAVHCGQRRDRGGGSSRYPLWCGFARPS